MKSVPAKVPANAVPVATRVRAWDGQILEFFVLTKWHRSHDRKVDGTRYYLPVAATERLVVWQGSRHDSEGDARLEAQEKADTIPGRPA